MAADAHSSATPRCRTPASRDDPVRSAHVRLDLDGPCGPADGSGARRGFMAFPALMLTLERTGITDVGTLNQASQRADALGQIGDDRARRVAILQFQSLLGILERMSRGGLSKEQSDSILRSLCADRTFQPGYDGRLSAWVRKELLPRLRPVAVETSDHDRGHASRSDGRRRCRRRSDARRRVGGPAVPRQRPASGSTAHAAHPPASGRPRADRGSRPGREVTWRRARSLRSRKR